MNSWEPALAVLVVASSQLLAGEGDVFTPGSATHSAPSGVIQSGTAQDLSAESQTQPPATEEPAEAYVSPWVTEVTKLVDANVQTPVVLEFINGAGTFGLNSDHIISLTAQGVPSEVISAMIQHDAQLAAGAWGSPPAPPAMRPIVLRLVPRRADSSQQQTRSSISQAQSIVNPSPAPELWLEHYWPDPDVPASAADHNSTAVRDRVPVRLTNTIIVHRGAGIMPNHYTLEAPETTLR